MQELINMISDDNEIGKNTPVDSGKLLVEKVYLKHKYKIELPEEFIEFLKNFNGLSADDAKILGIHPTSGFYKDIIEFNDTAILHDSADKIILGYDDFDYMVYNQSTKTYQMLEKLNNDLTDETPNLEEAIRYIIKR